ncbi:MAG: DUF4153 domain-containing protein [Gemmatimonadaceae bacterium]
MDQSHANRKTASLWIAAAIVAAVATWICYDAIPGVNWGIWTALAAAGLLVLASHRFRLSSPVAVLAVTATVIAAGASVTTNELMLVLILLSTTLLLAMAMLLATAPALERLTAGFVMLAPLAAFATALVSAFVRFGEATRLVRSPKARAAVRGIAITLPVLIVFALLLAVADPTFAQWRNAVENLLTSWDFLPRAAFFVVMLGIALGAYSHAATGVDRELRVHQEPRRWLGSGERLILLAGVTGLLWLFIAVQLSYMFGNLPRITGSGITFADYARRGFGELTIVSFATALLIIASERYGERDHRTGITRALTLALIVAVVLILGSAFYRVILYENAYGFTAARLYGQAFMILVAVAVGTMTLEVLGELDTGRLFRRVFAAAVLVLISLIYWNHEAWIAHRNIERFAATGKLDTSYLTRDLSLDAVPAIVNGIASLPEPVRSELRSALAKRYLNRAHVFDRDWFEASYSRARARAALETLGLP